MSLQESFDIWQFTERRLWNFTKMFSIREKMKICKKNGLFVQSWAIFKVTHFRLWDVEPVKRQKDQFNLKPLWGDNAIWNECVCQRFHFWLEPLVLCLICTDVVVLLCCCGGAVFVIMTCTGVVVRKTGCLCQDAEIYLDYKLHTPTLKNRRRNMKNSNRICNLLLMNYCHELFWLHN